MPATKELILMDVVLPEGVTLFKVLEQTEQGSIVNEVVFSVAPHVPRKYIAVFDDAEVFDEKCRILKVGHNTFTRVKGSTRQTDYDVVPFEPHGGKGEPIPPKG